MILGAAVPRRLVLSRLAQEDLDAVAYATIERFGWGQLVVYEARMRGVLEEIVRGPHVLPSRAEPELTRMVGHPAAVWSRHLGPRARHRWYYRVIEDSDSGSEGARELVQVARLLHDAMEPAGYVGEGFGSLTQ
ncbi:MAG: hypothetical protein AAF328_06975 [Planctomycetota bacterium]